MLIKYSHKLKACDSFENVLIWEWVCEFGSYVQVENLLSDKAGLHQIVVL